MSITCNQDMKMERESALAWRSQGSPRRLSAKAEKESEGSMRKQLGESRRTKRSEPIPDLSDFISDRFFFGDAVKYDPKAVPATVGVGGGDEEEEEEDEKYRSRRTQEWLEEARQIVSSSSFRESPSRRSATPRRHQQQAGGASILNYAANDRLSRSARHSLLNPDAHSHTDTASCSALPTALYKNDALSTSLRRSDPNGRFSNTPRFNSTSFTPTHIVETAPTKGIPKTTKQRSSATPTTSDPDEGKSPAAAVQHWFNSILKIKSTAAQSRKIEAELVDEYPHPQGDVVEQYRSYSKPPKQPTQSGVTNMSREIRGQQEAMSAESINQLTLKDVLKSPSNEHGVNPSFDLSVGRSNRRGQEPTRPRRSRLNVVVGASEPMRTRSGESVGLLSPPRKSNHTRSASASTCSFEKMAPSDPPKSFLPYEASSLEIKTPLEEVTPLNNFLERQKKTIGSVVGGDSSGRFKIILSGPDQSTSSMVAAICYAWLLESRGRREGWKAVPVINMSRRKMWEHRQAAWLFYHAGINPQALIFSDEVDLENLARARQLSIVVIGQDALKTNDEVASSCTLLTNDYCEQAYDLLQARYLKKLLLAGVLLDTHNLDASAVLFTTRDAEVVDLLLVGASPNHKNSFFDLLNQEHRDMSFEEALRSNYGEPFNNDEAGNEDKVLHTGNHKALKKDASEGQQLQDKPRSSKATLVDAKSQSSSASTSKSGKNKINQTFARWFGFGSR